jgi:outer membrane protein assembly factor BamA
MGFLDADVQLDSVSRKKRMKLRYLITPHERYTVRNVSIDIQDEGISQTMKTEGDAYQTSLRPGMDFDLNVLDAERRRLSNYLARRGYYKFTRDFVRFEADTAVGGHQADIKMILQPYRTANQPSPVPHQTYHIGDISYRYDPNGDGKPFVRENVIHAATELQSGSLYSEADVHGTYERLMRLGAVQSVNVHFNESGPDSTTLQTRITLMPSKLNSFNIELEGTNSAGDFGAAIASSYQNRNIFRGSELLNIKVRGAYEAIDGLSGYLDQDYIEYSIEAGIVFPDFKFPFLSRRFRRAAKATSEVSLMFDSQNRPEFHRRVVTAVWRYKWGQSGRRRQHRVDLLDLNYVFMPWISETFRTRYLDDPASRNAILRYNYENLFIMKWGYNFTYSSEILNGANSNYGTNAYTIRTGIETSGNLLYGLCNLFGTSQNDRDQFTLLNIAYAQYAKADFDFSKSFRFDERNSLALHLGFGIAYPYGNSTILPYEKRYFSGGANSVRGWSVRELGPGTFKGNDGRIDFINQTGDMKLDMNMEYRTHLFWKLDAAAFIDAGNIWTIRDYPDQPGGQFRFNEFWRQIAMAYGLGVRLNFNYFILRLDLGMKAVHPSYTDARHHFPIIHPRFSRDSSWHFAVGLPF